MDSDREDLGVVFTRELERARAEEALRPKWWHYVLGVGLVVALALFGLLDTSPLPH